MKPKPTPQLAALPMAMTPMRETIERVIVEYNEATTSYLTLADRLEAALAPMVSNNLTGADFRPLTAQVDGSAKGNQAETAPVITYPIRAITPDCQPTLSQRLKTLSAWCASRAEGQHDSATTLTMLSRKVEELRKRVLQPTAPTEMPAQTIAEAANTPEKAERLVEVFYGVSSDPFSRATSAHEAAAREIHTAKKQPWGPDGFVMARPNYGETIDILVRHFPVQPNDNP